MPLKDTSNDLKHTEKVANFVSDGVSSPSLRKTFRLNKFLAERLGISRREADDAIARGIVTLDGKRAELGARVDKNSKVCYNGKIVSFENQFLYLAFNKPVGYVCSRRAQGSAPTLFELLPKKYQSLKTVGRLDKDSSGLILLTNDGDFAFQMTHPRFRKTKVYEVELNKPLEPLHQQMISDYGVLLDDGPSRFDVFSWTGDGLGSESQDGSRDKDFGRGVGVVGSVQRYIVKLSEGRNRQIRRTFAALGYRVIKLHRIAFGKFQLSNLKSGEYEEFKIN